MLAADYIDHRSCIHCGAPAKKRGQWALIDGEWFFTAQPLICGERHVLPFKNAERWTHVTIARPKHNRDGEQIGVENIERYHYITTHECTNTDCKLGENLQLRDTNAYAGPHITRLMDAPESMVPVGTLSVGAA